MLPYMEQNPIYQSINFFYASPARGGYSSAVNTTAWSAPHHQHVPLPLRRQRG